MIFEISNQMEPQWGTKGANRILQNVINLINTFRYEVAYDRTLGISNDILHMPAIEAAAKLTNEIVTLVHEREPRAKVERIEYQNTSPDGELQFKVVVNIE